LAYGLAPICRVSAVGLDSAPTEHQAVSMRKSSQASASSVDMLPSILVQSGVWAEIERPASPASIIELHAYGLRLSLTSINLIYWHGRNHL
jgi:hypothetical protein